MKSILSLAFVLLFAGHASAFTVFDTEEQCKATLSSGKMKPADMYEPKTNHPFKEQKGWTKKTVPDGGACLTGAYILEDGKPVGNKIVAVRGGFLYWEHTSGAKRMHKCGNPFDNVVVPSKEEAKPAPTVTVPTPTATVSAPEPKKDEICKKDCKPEEKLKTETEIKSRADGRCFSEVQRDGNVFVVMELRANAKTGRLIVRPVDKETLKEDEKIKGLFVKKEVAAKNEKGFHCDGMQEQLKEHWEYVRDGYKFPKYCLPRKMGQAT